MPVEILSPEPALSQKYLSDCCSSSLAKVWMKYDKKKESKKNAIFITSCRKILTFNILTAMGEKEYKWDNLFVVCWFKGIRGLFSANF